MPCFLMESDTCFMAFHVTQVKYVNFCSTCVWESSVSWFILGAMSALGNVVFILFYFKKRNEKKKELTREEKSFQKN